FQKKSDILSVGGQKIGLIGITPEDNHDLASPGKNIIFTAPAKAVQAEVDKLTKAGINKIILLSHSGFDIDLDIARQTTGIDVIVGGHSNTYLSNSSNRAKGAYPTMIGDTAIVQAYAYGKYLGELNVSFDDDGRLVSAIGEPLLLDKHVPEDEAILARLAVLAKPLDEIRNKVVDRISAPINGDRKVCRVQECEMGNLVAEAMLDEVADLGVSIAIANSGGLRASIEAGDVTLGDVLTVLPFQNTLSTFRVTGQTVIDALENGVSQIEEGKGRFPQVAGLRFSFDMSIAPNEGRISSVMVKQNGRWQPIDLSKRYYLVSNNYVRGGGDGYRMFADARDVYDFGPDLADVVAGYLADQPDYMPFTDGRIIRK
ncbi:MAG: bifunctional metallophosphatase/5'-nucleotidase, partial [Candidatus Puniceispirillaceae bacterium]